MYQVRKFLGGEKMACTVTRAKNDVIATSVGKRRLQRYFKGNNKEGKRFYKQTYTFEYKLTMILNLNKYVLLCRHIILLNVIVLF